MMKRLLNAFKYSVNGLVSCFRYEASFRQELIVFLLALPLAFWFGENEVEILAMVGTILLVLIVELINSSIENINDRVSMEFHELSKRAKDQGSAAVALTIVLALATWLTMLLN